MKNKKKYINEEKYMYVNIDSHESRGNEFDHGDGSPYSGFNHTIITITNTGPCFYSTEGNGWQSNRVENIDPNVDWENLESCNVYLVLIRYTDGGTFSKTEGHFNLRYISPSLENVKQYVKDNEKKIKEDYSRYFMCLESIDCKIIQFTKKSEIIANCKDWWNK